jgi:DNA-binding CsgD family transcriptional regulator
MAGDLDLALKLSEESVELAAGLGENHVVAFVGVIYGWVLYERGEPARAAEVMVSYGGGEDLGRIAGGWRATQLEVLTRSWLAVGRIDDARRAAERAREVSDQVGLPRTAAMAHLATAAVALHDGDAAAASAEAQAAVLHFEKASAWVDAATARVTLGQALAQAGDVAHATTELEQAAAAFDRFGAPHWRDRAEHELRKLGHRVHRRSQPGQSEAKGVASLSGRELEVARLVVDRRTNREISAELFLGLKSVETHLRNIFRKLDVSSGVEVARALERAAT